MIKIDHHPFIEEFCDLEYIEDTSSSAAQIIMELIKDTKLECNSEIAKTLFIGLAADSNRFLFNSCTSKTFALVSYYLDKYPFNMNEVYQQLYKRPLAEVRLEGYISDEVTPDDKLNRLYNIMLINQNDKKLISKVYRDYTGILKSELNQIKNYKYITISNMLKDYIDGYTSFPFVNSIE